MQHLDEGTIHAWLDGALPPLEAEQVAKHAGDCAICAAAVAEARGIIAGSARIVSALDDVPGGVIPGRTTRPASASSAWHRLRLTPGRAALAATILLAVGTTLTVRSSSAPQLASDTVASAAARAAERPAAPAPAPHTVVFDSIKVPGTPAVNASALRNANVAAPKPQMEVVGKGERAVADLAAPRDTTHVLAKARVAAQEAVAGAIAPAPPAAMSSAVRGAIAPATALDQRADSASTFEGCYRLSADSTTGSTEMPSGLPASFALTRPSAEPRSTDARREVMARRTANFFRADSAATVVVNWQQLSTTQASVTFAGRGVGGARPVSLVLTAGSPVAEASSGDRTTKVRVVRTACPR